MSQFKTIEVIVQTDGTLEIDAVGFSGGDCEKATRFLEEALGQPADKRKKPEYFRLTRSTQKVGR